MKDLETLRNSPPPSNQLLKTIGLAIVAGIAVSLILRLANDTNSAIAMVFIASLIGLYMSNQRQNYLNKLLLEEIDNLKEKIEK